MLSEAQQSKIRTWFGWSARFHEMNRALEIAFDALHYLPADEAEVIVNYDRIVDIEGRLYDNDRNALDRLKVGAVSNIRMNTGELSKLKNEAALLVERIAFLLGVEIVKNAFRGSGGGGRLRIA